MRKAGFTKQERTFIVLMRVWGALFLGAGVLFALAPDYIPSYLQRVGAILLGWESPPFPPQGERFWLVLAVALLFTLSYLCLIVGHNIVRNIGYARPVILAKLVSSLGYIVCFLLYDRHFVYFVGAIVDGTICIVTWRLYAQAIRSRG